MVHSVYPRRVQPFTGLPYRLASHFSIHPPPTHSPPSPTAKTSPPSGLPPHGDTQDGSDVLEGCLFDGDDELTDAELQSPVEERSSVGASLNAGEGGELAPPSSSLLSEHEDAGVPPRATNGISLDHSTHCRTSLSRSFLATNGESAPSKLEAGSRPIDIVSSRDCGSKGAKSYKKNMKQMRENLLAEAWERKRDQTLHEENSHAKEKTNSEAEPASAFDCGKSSTPSSQAMKTRSRTRSLTDDDFDELRGCIDLGFGFTQDYNPDLCGTLPALEVCYAITENLYASQGGSSPLSLIHSVTETQTPGGSSFRSPISPWRIVSPGDHPQQVKARLRHWAQAVACTVRQCS